MYIFLYRNNLILDCIYGLIVVFVSLVCFISFIWLKDQLGQGMGPIWLEEDRRQLNHAAAHEAQEQVHRLHQRLSDTKTNSYELKNSKLVDSDELCKLHDSIESNIIQLNILIQTKFSMIFEDFWEKEVKILTANFIIHNIFLNSAMKKMYNEVMQ